MYANDNAHAVSIDSIVAGSVIEQFFSYLYKTFTTLKLLFWFLDWHLSCICRLQSANSSTLLVAIVLIIYQGTGC